jgi:hypothetical protein
LLIFIAVAVQAQPHAPLSRGLADTLYCRLVGCSMTGAFLASPTLFAAIGTPSNGAFLYCSDCTATNPCAGSGGGAMARRENGAWNCGGSAVVGTVTSVGNGTIGPLFAASWATATTTPALSFDFAALATNTVVGNATAGAAVPTALAVGSCSTASSALIWTTNTGFGCNTSITAASANALAAQATNTVVGNATAGSAAPTALSVGTCSTAGSALIWTTNTGFGCNTSITANTSSTATTATNATNVGITDDTSTNATMFLPWVTANTGNLPIKTSSTLLFFNPSTGALGLTKGQNAATALTITNTTVGASSKTALVLTSDAGNSQLSTYSSGDSGVGAAGASSTLLYAGNGSGTAGLVLMADGANNPLIFASGGQAERARLTAPGNFTIVNNQITAGTLTATNNALVAGGVSRFDWTNAMITALGGVGAGDLTVCTLPANTVVKNAYMVIDSPDTSTNALTGAIGRVSATYIDYIVASDLKAAQNTVYGDASGERGTNLTGYDLPSPTATTAVKLHLIKTSTNLSTVLGCTGHVYIETMKLP